MLGWPNGMDILLSLLCQVQSLRDLPSPTCAGGSLPNLCWVQSHINGVSYYAISAVPLWLSQKCKKRGVHIYGCDLEISSEINVFYYWWLQSKCPFVPFRSCRLKQVEIKCFERWILDNIFQLELYLPKDLVSFDLCTFHKTDSQLNPSSNKQLQIY